MNETQPSQGEPKVKHVQGKQESNGNSLFSEIERLEQELKFVTGKANRAELEELLAAKRKEFEEKDGKTIVEENAKNYEPGMSFTSGQLQAINALIKSNPDIITFLSTRNIIIDNVATPNDLNVKHAIDEYIKTYRTSGRIKVSQSGYHANTQELDAAVFGYEKAFSIESSPIRSLNVVTFELNKAKEDAYRCKRDIERVFEETGKPESFGLLNKKDYVPYVDFHAVKILAEQLFYYQKEASRLQEEYTELVRK
jgi:hypothetical protein